MAGITGSAVRIPDSSSPFFQQDNWVYQRIAELSGSHGGTPADFIFDISTFNHRLQQELGNAGVGSIGMIFRGQNPVQLAAAPLAGAIRAARDRYFQQSRPLPENIIASLAGHFHPLTLARARYAVGRVEISLPEFFTRENLFMDGHQAVTVDDVIVFREEPPDFSRNPGPWVHEIVHVDQYTRWGVESFALRYLEDFGGTLEGEALNRSRELAALIPARSRRHSELESSLEPPPDRPVNPAFLMEIARLKDELILMGLDVSRIEKFPDLEATLRICQHITERHGQLSGRSRRLPLGVRRGLEPYFDDNLLRNTMVLETDPRTDPIRMPLIDPRIAPFTHDHEPLILDNLLVFRSDMPDFEDAPDLWMHALTHVQQINQDGLRAFVFNYLSDNGFAYESMAGSRAQTIRSPSGHRPGLPDHRRLPDEILHPTPGFPPQQQEFFIAQCFFYAEIRPVHYLVTSSRRILVHDPITGHSLHIGFALPPASDNALWTYKTGTSEFQVLQNGGIMELTPVTDFLGNHNGWRQTQIGYVVPLR
jgi:hypothetical protein